MAAAKGGKVAKTASKNNPSSRKATTKMFFNNIQVKGVKVVGFEANIKGRLVRLGSFIAIANFQTEELLVDENGVPYDFKHAKAEA
jgi:hypothetical protein